MAIVEVTAIKVTDPSINKKMLDKSHVACVCNPSILKDLNIEEVEIQ
jgi:hypothetical protein